jgi:hypothetical protein
MREPENAAGDLLSRRQARRGIQPRSTDSDNGGRENRCDRRELFDVTSIGTYRHATLWADYRQVEGRTRA